METATTTPSFRAFLEQQLGLGQAVQVDTIWSLLSGKPAPRCYSINRGLLQAMLNGVDEAQWVRTHSAEEPGTVLYDAMHDEENFLPALMRVENYIQKELGKNGLTLTQGLSDDAKPFRRLMAAVRDYYRERCKTEPMTLRSSITMSRSHTELNWDVVVKFLLVGAEETALIAYTIPKVVQLVGRLITEIQAGHVVSAVKRFLPGFGAASAPFRELENNDPALLIVEHLIQQKDAQADTIYGIHKASVHVNRAVYRDPSDRAMIEQLRAWEHLDNASRIIWSTAVEIARVQLNGYLMVNKANATRGE